ncbi:acid-resistance protein, partial [Klebsiella pneumoniae]|nr:acid-resistance protein [Klebsiella pneumoniae]ELA0015726.1 acid-resistance protein [Klebsiella pneumoniae]ELA0272000.1 acid-resistance protein [Klebsiella pneumoniae]
ASLNGCQTRKQSGAGWNIFIGLLDLLIACLWLAMNPQQSWLFITAFIGVEMIFSAIGLLVLRNKMKHAQA